MCLIRNSILSFWVIYRRLNFIRWRFGTPCLFHLHRSCKLCFCLQHFRRWKRQSFSLHRASWYKCLYSPTDELIYWYQTFALFWMMNSFFWVIPRHLNFMFRRFGTLVCSINVYVHQLMNLFIDFKFSPCSELWLLSFGWFLGVWNLCSDVSAHLSVP